MQDRIDWLPPSAIEKTNPKIASTSVTNRDVPFIILVLFLAARLTKMSISIKMNGQPQMSFEQFEETFKQAFGREMTREESRWLRVASFLNSDGVGKADSVDDAA